MKYLISVIKQYQFYSKYLYTHSRYIRSGRNSINECYKSIQNDDELAKSLIDLSISNIEDKKEFRLDNDGTKSSSNDDFDDYTRKDFWEDYESFKKNPRYQDLTHQEYAQMYELRARERYNEFKREYNITNLATNPIYQGKLLLREIKRRRDKVAVTEENQDDYINQKVDDKKTLYEIVSRIRAKIRNEKLANSKIAKAVIPSVDGIHLDQIKAHVKMRCIRISSMLATHIEHIITNSSPTIVKDILKGASISIHHVKMTTSKSTCKVYYTILSEHDVSEIQKNLDDNAWKIRYFIAKKLQLGYTPPIKFINQSPALIKNIPKLYSKVVPPYVSSIEKPLDMQSLINPTNKDMESDEMIKEDVNELMYSNEGVESHIKGWKRTISGFG